MQKASAHASYVQGDMLTPVEAHALDPKERSCCICYQPFHPTTLTQSGSEVPFQLPCGHIFGELCIFSWTLSNNSCPLCRRKVLDIDDHHPNRLFSNSRIPNSLGSVLRPQDDVWLDEYVWNDSDSHRQDTVSSVDIETLLDSYTRDHSNVSSGSQPHTSLVTRICSEHRGFCHCSDDQDRRYAAVSHRRLTPPATAQTRQFGVDNFDLAELGSQFAELDYRYSLWMDEYPNNPSFGESSLFGDIVENCFTVDLVKQCAKKGIERHVSQHGSQDEIGLPLKEQFFRIA